MPPTRSRERFGLLARAGADDEIRPAPHDLVAVRLQLVGEVVGLLVRVALDAHLPGREAAGDELLLDVRQVGLRVPAVIVVEPVLEDDLAGVDAGLLELGVDERASLRRFRRRRRVDEHRVGIVRHGEPVELELLGQLLRARRDVDAEPLEKASRLLLCQLDADAPVVPGHRAQPSLPRGLAPGDRRARRPSADLLEQALPRRTEGSPELARPGRGDERLLERSSDAGWQPVCPSRVVRALAQAETGERERLVADAADPVRGLPRPAALDRLARVEEAEPAEPGDVGERRRLGRRNVDGLAEDGAEARRAGAEVRLGRERDVDLEAALEQEDAVEGRAGAHIPVVDGAGFLVDGARPVGDHLVEVGALGDAEEDVDVRPAVLVPERCRSGQRGAGDAIVCASPLEQAVSNLVALLRRVHARRPARRAASRRRAPTRLSGRGAS